MSVEQTALDAAHGERRASADLASLFRAHRSPAFYRLVESAMGLDRPESEPSLDTCEQLSRRGENPQQASESVGAREATQAAEALRASIARSRARQERVTELVMAGEVAHAERLARCMQQSVQLECPVMAGGCGSDDNYTPVTVSYTHLTLPTTPYV